MKASRKICAVVPVKELHHGYQLEIQTMAAVKAT